MSPPTVAGLPPFPLAGDHLYPCLDDNCLDSRTTHPDKLSEFIVILFNTLLPMVPECTPSSSNIGNFCTSRRTGKRLW
jgi:hypothetical protein